MFNQTFWFQTYLLSQAWGLLALQVSKMLGHDMRAFLTVLVPAFIKEGCYGKLRAEGCLIPLLNSLSRSGRDVPN